MMKWMVTIKPRGPASEERFLVGGFDREDAESQGVARWQSYNEDRYIRDIMWVRVEPYEPAARFA